MSKDILSTEQVAACQERIKNLKTRPMWPNTRWFADVEFETCLNTVEQIQAELAAEQAENKRLEKIIIRFKAGCKITGKGPVDKDCEMVRIEQAENKRLRDALEMARQLMEWAESKCHLNCADGYVPMMPDGDPEPCQWCVTKKAAEQALKEKL